MNVQDLSSYHFSADREISQSTFMAMDVPQGPGSALKFMTDEPSTCFTPNFESARVTQDSRADEEFERR